MSAAARFAVPAAALLGLAFPVLETARRGFGGWLERPVTMLEDYIAGALLLWAAAALARGRAGGWTLMLLAAAYTTGMMSSSFLKQLEAQFMGEAWEPNQGVVIAVKALLWGLPLALTVLAARAVAARPAAA